MKHIFFLLFFSMLFFSSIFVELDIISSADRPRRCTEVLEFLERPRSITRSRQFFQTILIFFFFSCYPKFFDGTKIVLFSVILRRHFRPTKIWTPFVS